MSHYNFEMINVIECLMLLNVRDSFCNSFLNAKKIATGEIHKQVPKWGLWWECYEWRKSAEMGLWVQGLPRKCP